MFKAFQCAAWIGFILRSTLFVIAIGLISFIIFLFAITFILDVSLSFSLIAFRFASWYAIAVMPTARHWQQGNAEGAGRPVRAKR